MAYIKVISNGSSGWARGPRITVLFDVNSNNVTVVNECLPINAGKNIIKLKGKTVTFNDIHNLLPNINFNDIQTNGGGVVVMDNLNMKAYFINGFTQRKIYEADTLLKPLDDNLTHLIECIYSFGVAELRGTI